MGRISDGTSNFFGKKAGQYDITKDSYWINRANQNASFAMGITQSLTGSIFNFVAWAADPERTGGRGTTKADTHNDGEISATGEEIKAEIDSILKDQNCASIDELNQKVEHQEMLIAKNEANMVEYEKAINVWDKEIGRLDELIKTREELIESMDDTDPRKSELEAELQDAKDKMIEAKNAREIAVNEKAETEIIINGLTEGLEDLKDAQKRVNDLQRALKNAEGKDGEDVIQEMSNDDTRQFTTYLTKLRRAINTGNQDEIYKAALDLDKCYTDYSDRVGADKIPDNIKRSYKLSKTYIDAAKEKQAKK